MYIGSDEYAQTFESIRSSSLSHSTCKVVIFASCLDIDALCAAKILAGVFKSDLIPHKIIPVVGYLELKMLYASLDDDIVNVILLGCGATVDLVSFLDLSQDVSNRKLYVIDNHRPWNLDNLFAAPGIVCFRDEEGDLEELREAYVRVLEADEEENEEGTVEETQDDTVHNSNDDNVNDNNDLASGDTDDDEDVIPDTQQNFQNQATQIDEQDTLENPNKRGSDSESPDPKRSRPDSLDLQQAESIVEKYYTRGTSISSSTTSHLYSLLSLIGETTVDNLWLTIVGTTSLDAQYPNVYSGLFPLLSDEVIRLCPPPSTNTNNTNSNNTTANTATNSAVTSSLSVETDYCLFLLRHWSLYQSILHSSYMSARLRLYTDDGRKLLNKMLAKMGIALTEAHEKWAHMHILVKKKFREKMDLVTSLYGIDGIIRPGIVRRYGFKGSVTAGDAVEALAALLQSQHETRIDSSETNSANQDVNKENFWVANFWMGWDALDSVNELIEGIEKAKFLQQSVAAAGSALFEKRLIKNLRAFRLAVLKDGPYLDIFCNPLALSRLAVWVSDACTEVSSVPLPLVVACLDTHVDTYMVLGMGKRKLRGAESDETDNFSFADPLSSINAFGSAFHRVANEINAKTRMDAFESSIIEVAKDDLARFLEALTLSGLV